MLPFLPCGSQAETDTTPQLCTGYTVCNAQHHSCPPPTTTSDRTCSLLDVCEAHYYESTAPTVTTNRACTARTACHHHPQYESVLPTQHRIGAVWT